MVSLLLLWPEPRRGEPPRQAETTVVVDLSAPSPTPDPPPPPQADSKGAHRPASPSAPPIPVATPIPVLAAALPTARPSLAPPTDPAIGDEPRGGAASGTGQGPGGGGDGDGGMSGGQRGSAADKAIPARWIGGAIRDSDYPRLARTAGEQGRVETRIAVDKRGRATGCAVTRSSGSAELDQATCRLILRRFRFSPARDAAGRPVPGSVPYDQQWVFRTAGAD